MDNTPHASRLMQQRAAGSDAIYFHFPCFDGLISSAIAADHLTMFHDWKIEDFRPVDYDLKAQWLDISLPHRSAVVDFLYHPGAVFWADHHATTFLTSENQQDYLAKRDRPGEWLIYDPEAQSCALLLFERLRDSLSDPDRYRDMAQWADKIDSASYSSVEEAVYGGSPAMDINLGLSAGGADSKYAELLVRSLLRLSLEEVSALPEVQKRTITARRRIRAGLKAVEKSVRLVDGDIVAVSTSESEARTISRYSPYIFYPDASYSLSLTRTKQHWKITAMRNPWRQFRSIELGELFRKYGGGGHRRVASVIVPGTAVEHAQDVFDAILGDIRESPIDSAAV